MFVTHPLIPFQQVNDGRIRMTIFQVNCLSLSAWSIYTTNRYVKLNDFSSATCSTYSFMLPMKAYYALPMVEECFHKGFSWAALLHHIGYEQHKYLLPICLCCADPWSRLWLMTPQHYTSESCIMWKTRLMPGRPCLPLGQQPSLDTSFHCSS